MAQAGRFSKKRPFGSTNDDDEDEANFLEEEGQSGNNEYDFDNDDGEQDFDVAGDEMVSSSNQANQANKNDENPAKKHTSYRRQIIPHSDIIEDHIFEPNGDFDSDDENDSNGEMDENGVKLTFDLIEENLAPSEDEDGNPIPIFTNDEPIITQSLHQQMSQLSISGNNGNNGNDGSNNNENKDEDIKMGHKMIETALDLNWESSDDEMQSQDGPNKHENDNDETNDNDMNEIGHKNDENKENEMKDEKKEDENDQQVWFPSQSKNGENGGADGQESKYEYDQSAYSIFHQFNTEWPCLSFDFINDNLGAYRTNIPHTVYLACGTQANPEYHNPDINTPNIVNQNKLNYRTQNKILLLKLSNLQKTKYDMDESDENEMNDKDYADITDDNPVLQDREIIHEGGCVNRLRCNNRGPNPHLISTWGEDGCVYIWDANQHVKSLDGKADNLDLINKNVKPVFKTQNLEQGFGLAWSVIDSCKLLTGSCAGELCLYQPKSGSWIRTHKFKTPKTSIEDIAWSTSEANIFAVGCVDKCIRVFDTRPSTKCQCVSMVKGCHNEDVNVISWNPISKHLLLSGSDDHSFKVWDIRKLPKAAKKKSVKPYAHYKWHTGAITSIEWCPHEESTLSVSGEDNQISIWDLSLEEDNGEPVRGASLPKDMKIPPQLVFVHAGQQEIKEVRWHPQIPNMMVSTAGSGFHVFQPDNLVEAMENVNLD